MPLRSSTAALTAGALNTTMVFDGDAHVGLRQRSALASALRRLTPRLSLQVGAGTLLGGWLEDAAGRHDLAPGGVALAGLTCLALPPRDGGPFLAIGTAHSLAATLPGRFDLLLEWAPLGARALTAALGRSL